MRTTRSPLTGTARRLRCDSTDAERVVWQRLRNRQLDGHKFRRQCAIGPYVVDFVCLERRLVVELDGGQHSERVAQDLIRTSYLEGQGFRVLRFWNDEVLSNFEGVWTVLSEALGPGPSP